MKANKILFLFLLNAVYFTAPAQKDSSKTKFIIDIPVIDLPANADHGGLAFKQFSPSMQQSLAFSKSIAEAQQYYTQRLFFNPNRKYTTAGKIIRGAGLITSDILLEYYILFHIPPGTGWLHEEWHRAVMNKNNVRSFNDMNKFPLGQSIVSVSHTKDEDLAKFKLNNNADFTRMGEAGIEAQYEYVKAVQKDNFFYNRNLASSASYWFNTFNSVQYVRVCASIEGDSTTIQLERKEGSNVKKRDFTGLDMTGWIYDLSRPAEPYTERGIHPSGTGIRRYRRTTDLTREERAFLIKVARKQWLNFASPTMLFINAIKINQNLKVNFALFHLLTSFGYDAGSNFFINYKNNKIFFAIHNYHNLKNSFYGVEAQLLDKKVKLAGKELLLSPSAFLWTQPKDLAFRTDRGEFGCKTELMASMKLGNTWQPYITLSAKTKGWVAGDVYQNSNFSGRFGIRALIK